jgi:hypothetical protein
MPIRIRKPRLGFLNRPCARGGIVREDSRRQCGGIAGNCRPKCNRERRSCTRLGSISKDPIGFAAGDVNQYRYVGNGPTNATDPSGLMPPDGGLVGGSYDRYAESIRDLHKGRPASPPSKPWYERQWWNPAAQNARVAVWWTETFSLDLESQRELNVVKQWMVVNSIANPGKECDYSYRDGQQLGETGHDAINRVFEMPAKSIETQLAASDTILLAYGGGEIARATIGGIRYLGLRGTSRVVNLTPRGNAAGFNAMKASRQKGVYDVIAHGNPNTVQVASASGKIHNGVSPRALARYLSMHTKYTGGPVRLLSCSTGSSHSGFAANVSSELSVFVLAPNDTLWVTRSGQLFVSRKFVDALGRSRPVIPPTGGFVPFKP